MQRSYKAVLADRMRGALLTFKFADDCLRQARAHAELLAPTEAYAFWAGPGYHIKQRADAAAWWAVTVYKAYVAAGLAGCMRSGDRDLVIAANRHFDQHSIIWISK